MNLYSLRGVTVVVDLAHNEASLQALLHVARGVCAPGAEGAHRRRARPVTGTTMCTGRWGRSRRAGPMPW